MISFDTPCCRSAGCLEVELSAGSVTAQLVTPHVARGFRECWDVDGTSSGDWSDIVAAALDRIVGRSAPMVRLIVPDPMLKLFALDIDALPARRSEAEALIKWRLRDEFHLDSDRYRYDYTTACESGSVVVFALESEWLDHVETAFGRCNMAIAAVTGKTMDRLRQSDLSDSSTFVINTDDDFVSYGLFGTGLQPVFFESRFIATDDAPGRQQFLQRARREFAASRLQGRAPEESAVVDLSDVAHQEAVSTVFADVSVRP